MKTMTLTTRKGQKSLEMIVGLVILLVVASVVISMFLNIFQTPEVGQDTVEMSEIERECQTQCNTWKQGAGINSQSAAVEYCTSRFNYDSNGDGTLSDVSGTGFNSYCEDGVHCFNVQTCEQDFEQLDAGKCQQTLCDYFQDSQVVGEDQANPHDAGQRIFSYMEPGTSDGDTGVGSCGLNDLQDETGNDVRTWWSTNYELPTAGGSTVEVNYDGNTVPAYAGICGGNENWDASEWQDWYNNDFS